MCRSSLTLCIGKNLHLECFCRKRIWGEVKTDVENRFSVTMRGDLTAQSVSQKQILVLWYDDDRFVDNLYYPFIRIRG